MGKIIFPTPFIRVVCNVVRTDTGLSESFKVNVGFHQGAAHSIIINIIIKDVVNHSAVLLASYHMIMLWS